MNSSRSFSTIALFTLTTSTFARAPDITVQTPPPTPIVGSLLKPFHLERRTVSPARLSNTPRLESLVRGGNLYMSVPHVIALVLENNVDIAIQRYGPALAREALRRASGGGLLRTVGTPVYPGPVSVSLQGVSVNAVGLAESGSGVSSGRGLLVGSLPPPPALDPFLFAFANFAPHTAAQSNTFLVGVPTLLDDTRSYQFGYGQSFLTGTSGQLFFGSFRSALNSPNPLLNPYTNGVLDFSITQNLLQGFGIAVNNRSIRVAKNNMRVTDLQVKRQVITTVSAVLNLYWDLGRFNEDLRIKEQAPATAQKLLEDNKKQVAIGTLSAIEVTRAAAEVSSGKENLLIAQTNVAQQETVLKNALSRNGVASPWLDDVHVIAIDHIQVPEKEDLKPIGELVEQAIAKRPELEQTRINVESTRINLKGSQKALLPTLQAFAGLSHNALT